MISFIASNIPKLVKAGLITIQIDHKSMLGNQTSDFQTHALCICVLLTVGKRTATYPIAFEPCDSTAAHEFVPILEDVLQVFYFTVYPIPKLFIEVPVSKHKTSTCDNRSSGKLGSPTFEPPGQCLHRPQLELSYEGCDRESRTTFWSSRRFFYERKNIYRFCKIRR